MTNELALFGGEKVRNSPYPEHTTMIDEREERLVLDVLRSGHLSGFSARAGERFLGGPMVRKFERDFETRFGVRYAVSFNSATSALHGAVAAAGVGPGDEVIVPPTTMSATATSIIMQNAVPVFADIENVTYGLDPMAVENAVTRRTKAILAVNLFGHPARLHEIKAIAQKHRLILIEDNAQSPGALCEGQLTGTIGEMGIQSLNYHKMIQTGEGGLVLTNDARHCEHLQLVRNHGEVVVANLPGLEERDFVNIVGWNYRLTELQAAVGIPQLEKMDFLVDERIKLARALTEALRQFPFLTPPIERPGCSHVYYLYPIRFDRDAAGFTRSQFVKTMQAEGISIGAGYVKPIYLEPMYQKRIAYGAKGCPFTCPMYDGAVIDLYRKGRCPTAEKLYFEEILTTDICKYPNSSKEIEQFVEAVMKIWKNRDHVQRIDA